MADGVADEHEARYLNLAARLGLRGLGRVEPNPMVGAVIVKDGIVLGMGHHRRVGGRHAEAEALADARSRGNEVRGATLYSTLEPCASEGRNPPCVDAVTEAGIVRVVYASSDPSPRKGGGAGVLAARGVAVSRSGASPLASGLAEPFIARCVTGRPWTMVKWAQTVDGRVATRTGESKWISNDRARRRVHQLRARVDAILTGSGTVAADDPMLTPRNVRVVRRAARVVADTDLDIDPRAALVRSAGEVRTLVACETELAGSEIVRNKREALRASGVELVPTPAAADGRGLDLAALLRSLWASYGFATVLVEAGPGLLGSLFELDLVDEAVVYIAPMLLGDELARSAAVGRIAESLHAARRLRLWNMRAISGDVELTYRRPARAG